MSQWQVITSNQVFKLFFIKSLNTANMIFNLFETLSSCMLQIEDFRNENLKHLFI